MEDNPVPTTLRRRRRKKDATEPHSALEIHRQDAELEKEVDSYLNWGRSNSNSTRKRQRRVHDGIDDSLEEAAKVINNDGKGKDISRSLPMLLHLREIGLSRRMHDKDGMRSSTANWKSQILYRSMSVSASSNKMEEVDSIVTSASTTADEKYRDPVHPSSAPYSQWNALALQYSSPTYYGIYNNNNSHTDTHNTQHIKNKNSSIKEHTNDNFYSSIQSHRQTWRPYTIQKIPFSKLQTPHSDAILAMSRCGGYLIGVGGGGIAKNNGPRTSCKGMRPHLSIKFYGIPSPARLQQTQTNKKPQFFSPLIHTVPLLLGSIENRNYPAPSSILGHNEYASPAAEIPIQILLSDNGSLGVAFLHHSTTAMAWSSNNGPTFSESPALQDEDILGTIVIFGMPRVATANGKTSKFTKSFRCSNVRVGGWSSFTMRNALWPTTLIPTATSSRNDVNSRFLCNHFRKALSAYMLFNDEDDGFRITWIRAVDDNLDENEGTLFDVQFSPNAIRPTRNDIVVQSEGNAWEECLSDPETGYRQTYTSSSSHAEQHYSEGLNIAYEVYLRIDALLSDIISRRRKLSLFKKSPYQNECVFFMPNFFYNLIGVSPDSLKATLVIAFSNKEKMMKSNKKVPSSLGVFVEVNLFDQSYDELKWVQHPSCNDAPSMKQWCNSLALNWRMRECRVGIFCLDSTKFEPQMENWVCGTHECNVDDDLNDDLNVEFWGDYVERRNNSKRKSLVVAPKDISMSSLYPYCDVITNRAVHNAVPVKRMASRNSPIELIYG